MMVVAKSDLWNANILTALNCGLSRRPNRKAVRGSRFAEAARQQTER
jgi:hypothetical protein